MEKGNTQKKKNCNKKFCYDCLQKSFPNYWENRTNKDWKCPCCFNDCTCNQCKKNLIKSQKTEIPIRKMNQKDNEEINEFKNEKNKYISMQRNIDYNNIFNNINNDNVFYNEKVFAVDNNNLIVSKDICAQAESTVRFNSNHMNKSLISKRFVYEYDKNHNKEFAMNNFQYENEISQQINYEKRDFDNDLAKDSGKTFNLRQDKNKIDMKIMKIVEKKTINTKPKNEYIPESMFLNLKRLREEYTKVYEKYKDSMKS